MKLGIVGLPNVGKSTLFNAITNAGAESANYPFCTIDPNVGVVAVPDHRLDALTEMSPPQERHPAWWNLWTLPAWSRRLQGPGPGQQVSGQHPGVRRHRPRGALLR